MPTRIVYRPRNGCALDFAKNFEIHLRIGHDPADHLAKPNVFVKKLDARAGARSPSFSVTDMVPLGPHPCARHEVPDGGVFVSSDPGLTR
ncbi:MAG: hypothetical protein M3Q60_12760 [Actinomycetota bacterium]|nr:hypothetical protein [Actinomycetota bacterium]